MLFRSVVCACAVGTADDGDTVVCACAVGTADDGDTVVCACAVGTADDGDTVCAVGTADDGDTVVCVDGDIVISERALFVFPLTLLKKLESQFSFFTFSI